MKEVVSIETKEAVDQAVKDDVEQLKSLEETMATDEATSMPKQTVILDDEESLAEIVSRGIEHQTEADALASAGLSTEIEVEGVGTVSVDIPPVGRVYTPPAKKVGGGPTVFDSGLKVIKTHSQKIPISVPVHIRDICDILQRRMGKNEFSIVCKGQWADGEYIVSDDYKVPKQVVAGASVDYDLEHLESLKLAGYNTVIHSHPFKSSNFSSSDEETINSHFECSILYSVGEFPTATIAISSTPGMKFILTGDPQIDHPDGLVPEDEINNIDVKSYSSGYKGGLCGPNYYDDWGMYGNYQNNLGSRNVKNGGRNIIGSDPDECEKEYERSQVHNHEVVKTRNFVYDADDDTLAYKNGKPVHRSNSPRGAAREAARTVQPIKVHGCGCGCGAGASIPDSKIFRTETAHANQKVFRTADSPKNKDSIKTKNNRKNR